MVKSSNVILWIGQNNKSFTLMYFIFGLSRISITSTLLHLFYFKFLLCAYILFFLELAGRARRTYIALDSVHGRLRDFRISSSLCI